MLVTFKAFTRYKVQLTHNKTPAWEITRRRNTNAGISLLISHFYHVSIFNLSMIKYNQITESSLIEFYAQET